MATPTPFTSPDDLPVGVTATTVNGADALHVSSSTSEATLLLDGAQLISWIPAGGQDLLWVSPEASYGPGMSVRGGIPLVGPWFGPGRDGTTPYKHGWLRSNRWTLTGAQATPSAAQLQLELADPERSGLLATVHLGISATLRIELTLTAGPQAVQVESALHTYLAVTDVRRSSVGGLGGVVFLDNTRGLAPDEQEEDSLLPVPPLDRVYETPGHDLVIRTAEGRRIRSAAEGTNRTVVWNPGADGAAQLGDMPTEAWAQFLCVEPAVCKDGAIDLAPGESHTIAVTYSVEDLTAPSDQPGQAQP